jgi:Lon protease-like protein
MVRHFIMEIFNFEDVGDLQDNQQVVPIFTLDSLLMPGEKMFMRVFEPRYKQMLDDVLLDDLPYGHVMSNPSMTMLNGWSTPFDIGTLVKIEKMEEQGTNILYDAIGGKRFRIIALIEPSLPPENFGSIFPSVNELEEHYVEDNPNGKLYSRALIEIMPPLRGSIDKIKWDNLLNIWEHYINQIIELTGMNEEIKSHIESMKDIFSTPVEESLWALASMIIDTQEAQVACLKAEFMKEIVSMIESNLQIKMKRISIFREGNQ